MKQFCGVEAMELVSSWISVLLNAMLISMCNQMVTSEIIP